MQTLYSAEEIKLTASVVTIGMFDGVHRGHRRVLRQLGEAATQLELPRVLITFDPHPRAVLRPDNLPALLQSLPDKVELLASTRDVDHCLVLPFSRQRSEETVEDFVQSVLVGQLGVRKLVVGANFACGKGRAGTIARLTELGAKHGFEVEPVALYGAADTCGLPPCSSTETRRLIQAGNLAQAAAMLERPHELTAPVAPKFGQRGLLRLLPRQDMCIPPDGEYMAVVRRKDRPADWCPATLRVLTEDQEHRRTLLLPVEQSPSTTPGAPVTVRFLDRARGHAVALA
jgi:riboflavin kinase/FMN adenylyltransferase